MNWDYVIVGAGSAGCALAYELVKSGRTVLLIEAGGQDRSASIKFPAAVFRASANYNWGYTSQPDPSRNGVRDQWYRGRVLGGSSSVNGTKYVRGTAQDFDRWSECCGQAGGWSASDVMPIFREFETSDQTGPLRGRSGPLHVRTVKRPHRITQAFIRSANAAGYPFNPDYNGEAQEGVAYTQFSQRRGLRCSAADAFLRPILGRKNLKLLVRATVEKVEFAEGRAVGVVVRQGGQRRLEVARHVVLCAGAINSPKLLLLSGIGDRQELQRHGIPVVLDLPSVGRNLQDQPLLRLTYRTRVPTYNLTEGPLQKLSIAAEFMLHGEGPIANLFDAVAFLKSSADEPEPDIRLTFLAVAYSAMPDGTSKLAPYPGVMVSLIKSYPRSYGHVRLASSNPDDPPIITCPLFDHPADLETMFRGIGVVRQVMSTEPIAGLIEEEVTPGKNVSDQGLEEFVRSRTGLSLHSIGTCRMGSGSDAVVGPNLQVRGTENLWVADASIMPRHISADTNAASIMIGAKLGRQLASASAADRVIKRAS